MGSVFSAVRPDDIRNLVIGLKGAGKTTVLCRLINGERENVVSINVTGHVVKTVEHNGICFIAWDTNDIPASDIYYKDVRSIIYVVDSNDREKITEARESLHHLMSKGELQNSPLLVLCNKQDLPNAMNSAEITDKLGLHGLRGRTWYVQPTCATTGEGLKEGFKWLNEMIQK